MIDSGHVNADERRVKLPVTEYVDTEERFVYGTESRQTHSGITDSKQKLCQISQKQEQQQQSSPGLIGKTGQLIGSVGSGIWSGATGAVSFGVGALYTGVSKGVSVSGSIVQGVASYIPLPRARANTEEAIRVSAAPDSPLLDQEPPAKTNSTLMSKVLFRKPAKDKAE